MFMFFTRGWMGFYALIQSGDLFINIEDGITGLWLFIWCHTPKEMKKEMPSVALRFLNTAVKYMKWNYRAYSIWARMFSSPTFYLFFILGMFHSGLYWNGALSKYSEHYCIVFNLWLCCIMLYLQMEIRKSQSIINMIFFPLDPYLKHI